MRIASDDFFSPIRVDIRILKKPHPEFPLQHWRHEGVDQGLAENSLANKLDNVAIAIRIRQFNINPGFYSQSSRLFAVLSEVITEQLRTFVEFANGIIIRYDISLESPLFSKNIVQQPSIGMRWNSVDFVIGRHHTHRSCFLNGLPEGWQKHFAQNPFGNVYRCAVGSGLRLTMCGKMLERGNDMFSYP